MTKLPSIRWIMLLAMALCVTPFSGCQQLQLTSRDPLAKFPKSSSRNPVKEVICLWEPAEGTGLDGRPCRGFAGQVLFFATNNEAPVIVDGTIDIYVFDDQGKETEQAEPIETFTFTADQWDLFTRPNNSLGATYQLFVPYTRKGSHQAICTIRVRYTPPDDVGIPIYSKMASILLTGPKSPAAKQASAEAAAKQDEVFSRGAAPRPANFEELRQIAHSATQPEISQNRVTPAVFETPTATIDDRARLKQKMAEALGESPATDPQTVPWKPESRTVRPQPLSSAGQPAHQHPLQGL